MAELWLLLALIFLGIVLEHQFRLFNRLMYYSDQLSHLITWKLMRKGTSIFILTCISLAVWLPVSNLTRSIFPFNVLIMLPLSAALGYYAMAPVYWKMAGISRARPSEKREEG